MTKTGTFVLLAGVLGALVGGCGGGDDDGTPASSSEEQNLVGGSAESRWRAVGYVAEAGTDEVLCGATLVASNVIVTAAHCIDRSKGLDLEFGVGETKERVRTKIRSYTVHPDAHLEADGDIDLVHTLLLYDVAYAILDAPVEGVVPARLAKSKPRHGDKVQLVAYGALGNDSVRRKGVAGSVLLNAKLASDTIVEIVPRDGGAVCQREGDEGHAAVVGDASGTPTLVGIYVGSVTQSFTDCRRYLQYLNGYEATFGYAGFYEEGIAEGEAALREDTGGDEG